MDFKFPDVGEGITEGEIVQWLVKEGDMIKQDQTIGKIETDKAVVDIPSPVSGRVAKILVPQGKTVKVGQVMIIIDEKGKSSSIKSTPSAKKETLAPKKEMQTEKKFKSVGVVGELEEAKDIPVPTPEVKAEASVREHEDILALPAVRKLAKELGVDLSDIKGSGSHGQITEEDIKSSAPTEKKIVTHPDIKVVKKYDFYGYVEHIPLHGLRKTIANNMIKSHMSTALVTHMDECDVTHLVEIREKEKDKCEKEGVHLTYLPFVIKALIPALQKHPLLNAVIDDINQEIILKKYYSIGIAVDTDEGLIVPVIKNVQLKKLIDLAKEITTLATAARNRTIDLGDIKGGTFTITNVGSLGGTYATPILNYPEVANLCLGKIQERPVVKKGRIEIRHMMTLSLSFDHRIIDGAEAARFLNDVIIHLEDPDMFLIE
ncbi:MAG: dihydrolipoamide acetyltransferase family protein [Candidatus Woesearchaeota archaeon]|nr:dihydrolipoamide acetyltransferase family protein [Candidatus Woesearchaeota archaeon]